MLVVQAILMMCLTKYGENVKYPKPIQDLDVKVARCADRVTACYYKGKQDVFLCLKKESDPIPTPSQW